MIHPLMGSPSWSAQCWKIPKITSGKSAFLLLKPHWKSRNPHGKSPLWGRGTLETSLSSSPLALGARPFIKPPSWRPAVLFFGDDLDFWCRNLPWKSWKSWPGDVSSFQFMGEIWRAGFGSKSAKHQSKMDKNWLGMPPWLRKPPY